MDVNTLQYQAGLASFVTDRNVEGLTHEDSLKQPREGGNCLNWNLGHLVRARLAMLQVLGADAPYAMTDYDVYENEPITSSDQAQNWDTLVERYRKLQERWTPSAGQLIDVAKWNLLRYIPVKMRGAEDDKEETAKPFASL